MDCIVKHGLGIYFSTLTSHQNHLLILTHLTIHLEKNKDPEFCQIVSLYNYAKINYRFRNKLQDYQQKTYNNFCNNTGRSIFFLSRVSWIILIHSFNSQTFPSLNKILIQLV